MREILINLNLTQFSAIILRITQSNPYIISLTEYPWEFPINDALWDILYMIIMPVRCFYTHMMDSMEKLGTNLIQSRVDMRIGQARHAASHDNVDLSKTLLRAVYKVR